MKSFHSAAENERFTAAALCCCQNLKYRNFTLSSDYVKEMYLNAYVMSAAIIRRHSFVREDTGSELDISAALFNVSLPSI